MNAGDGIVIYSPKTAYPDGDPLRAITVVGTVTGAAPEPSELIANGYRRRADLREIEPIALDQVRDHLPTSRLRFGCFNLSPADATANRRLIDVASGSDRTHDRCVFASALDHHRVCRNGVGWTNG